MMKRRRNRRSDGMEGVVPMGDHLFNVSICTIGAGKRLQGQARHV